MDDTNLAITQEMITVAADELYRSGAVRVDAEPTGIMVAVARMLHAAFKVRARTIQQARDIEPTLQRKLIVG